MSQNNNDQAPSARMAAWSIPEYFEELVPDQLDLVVELIELFLGDASSSLRRLGQQVKDADVVGAKMTIHSLKGSSRQIGGLDLGEIAEEIEMILEKQDTARASMGLARAEAAFHTLRLEMESHLATLAGAQQSH